jgi:RND family efflux transporter MFP subunit
VSTVKSADISSLRIDRARKPPGRGPGFWIGITLLFGVLLAGGSFLATGFRRAPEVQVAVVEAAGTGGGGPVRSEILTANGYVVPRLKASVSSEVGGRLAALYVEEGDTAAAGQVLGVLRNDDFKAQIRADEARAATARANIARARAELERARIELRRQKEVVEKGLGAQTILDDAQNRVAVAEADLAAAEATEKEAVASLQVARENLEKTFIKAPFAGTVLRKEAEVGEIVSPLPANGGLTRGAIVTMADLTSSEMVVDVNEGYVARIREGLSADVELDAYTGVRFPARVRQIVPTADRQKATVQVKVSFDAPDPRILPEMGGKVYFMQAPDDGAPAGAPSAIVLVPTAAIAQADGRSIVWIVKDGRVSKRPVELLGPVGDKTRIGAGLAGGETVVVTVPEGLKDGAKVTVAGGRS